MDINFQNIGAIFVVALCLILIGYHIRGIEKLNKKEKKLDVMSGWHDPFVTAVASYDTTSLENNAGSEHAIMYGKVTNENTILESIKPYIEHNVVDESPYRKFIVSKLDIRERRN